MGYVEMLEISAFLLLIPFASFDCSVDDGFPPVTFHFGSSLSLKVYPREYLFPYVSML